ncbi:hypothetical protein Golomagni_05115 [Golovinomyces magnicellulatus]|nr:hypothetical protein Golomagni_05115 [Golovinomyces magnicellulatus]
MDDFPTIKRSFINTYLDSPIVEGDTVRLLIEIQQITSGDVKPGEFKKTQALLKLIPDYESLEFQLYDPHEFKILLHELPSNGAHLDITKSHRLAIDIFKDVCAKLDIICHIQHSPLSLKQPSSFYRLYLNKAELFVRYVDTLSCSRASGSQRFNICSYGNFTLIGDQYCCALFQSSDPLVRLMPYEFVLMFKDLCLARANVFDGIRILFPSNTEMESRIVEILSWCEDCLVKYGNAGYEILKGIEAITKAFMIDREDKIFSGDGALQRLTKILRQKELDLDPSTTKFSVDNLVDILRSCDQLQTIIQIFGLQKISGHPLIDPQVGGTSAAQTASENKNILYSAAVSLRNNWCRLYLEGFIHKTNRWPEIHFPMDIRPGNRLFQLYSLRERNITKSEYPLLNWNKVRFKKHLEFDYHDNYLELMDDKSLSLYLSDFRSTWNRDQQPRSHRRLLMEMLSRKSISIREIIHLIESGQMPSEREFKLAARMFSMMVFEMRAFFTCLESNLADKVFPYIQQQTMTLSKNEIISRFGTLTRPVFQSGVYRLFLEIDLSRWNLKWRDQLIKMIGEDLNDMFGMKVAFSTVHEFFKKCLIVVRHSQYPPPGLYENPPPQSDLLWYNHEGGFEGIAQKTWSLATFSMIDLGIRPFGLNYRILGQGDNQVILAYVKVPLHEEASSYIKNLTSRITHDVERECKKVGQDAKTDECLESTTVITYSKDIYINGVENYLSLKAISRIFPRGTSDFPTISDCLESIASSCITAAEKLENQIMGYYIYLNHAVRYLYNFRHRSPIESLTLRQFTRKELITSMIRNLLILPNALGGISVAGPINFIHKGGSDILGKQLSNLYLFGEEDGLFLRRCITTILHKKWTSSDQSIKSIWFTTKYTSYCSSEIQQISLQHVKATTQNRDLKQLMETNIEIYEKQLQSTLLKVTPFNPSFLSDILTSSVIGIRDSVTRMFTATRTVQMLTQGDEMDPGMMILTSSSVGLSNLISRLKQVEKTPIEGQIAIL